MSWGPNVRPVKVNACTTEMIKEFKKNEIAVYQQTNLCVPIICGISDMWLFLRSSHLKLGKQSNKSSGNEEIKFPSKYKN